MPTVPRTRVSVRRGMTSRSLAVLTAAACATLAAPGARADEVRGRVLDAADGAPVAGVRVVAVEAGSDAITDDDGSFAIEIGALGEVTLAPEVGESDPDQAVHWVHQTPDRPAELRVFTTTEPADGPMGWGAPLEVRPEDPTPRPEVPVRLDDFLPGGPLTLTLPTAVPSAIRVGRRFSDTCSGHPVQRIDTIPLEEYAEGVLIPEIGVFRAVEGGPDSAAAVFEAFAVAARSYALWFYFSDPDADYHIDDTACNQRYDDARAAWVADRVAATAGELLVAAADHAVLEKFEYAASCGRHGTLPEFQESTVPDETGEHACVGSWCGHDDCAGHQVNPDLPDAGRCLVRGICQWGGVERSMAGTTYLDILGHYQPNLDVITIEETVDAVEAPDAGGVDTGAPDIGVPDVGVVDADVPDAEDSDSGGVIDADDEPTSDASRQRFAPALYTLVDDGEPGTRGCVAAGGPGRWSLGFAVPMVAALARRRPRRRPNRR